MQMANEKDPAKLKELVTQDMLLATAQSRTPVDGLPAVSKELLARRPGDKAFAGIVQQQGDQLTKLWQTQGRTHAVWDPLIAAHEKGDVQGVKDIVTAQCQTLASTSPTQGAIQQYQAALLAAGPQAPKFQQAVNEAANDMLVRRPADAARQVTA